MSTTAPTPPTKPLLTTACVASATLAALVIASVDHFIYGNAPTNQIVAYSLAVAVGLGATGALAGRHLLQKCRQDGWRDGWRAARDAHQDSLDDEAPMRRIQTEIENLTEAVIVMAEAIGRPRAPQPRDQPTASTYASRAAQDDTVPIRPWTGDAEAPGAAVQLAERKHFEPDPVAEARAEGYAEGYVDGIARRRDDDEDDDPAD